MHHRQELLDLLRKHSEWRILNVGAWEQLLMPVTHNIDILPYETAGHQGFVGEMSEMRYDEDTWVQQDVCTVPWPYPDKYFDFVVCSNVLEDIRDPMVVCSEMSRIGKAGFIEIPTPRCEMSWDKDDSHTFNQYPGYWHHRWLFKPAYYETDNKERRIMLLAYPKHISLIEDKFKRKSVSHDEGFITLWWEHEIKAQEQVYLDRIGYDNAIMGVLGNE